MSRKDFREACLERDDDTCLVPWCDSEADDVHHIIERSLWEDDGYFLKNGASVCNSHHQDAERNEIPPQAFWRWLDISRPVVPVDGEPFILRHEDEVLGGFFSIDKWGERFDTPPHYDLRDFDKYPSTRHLPFSHVQDDDDTAHREVDCFLDKPLVVTLKMDGSNAMMVKDEDEPVRSRRGRKAEHDSFDQLHKLYWETNVYEELPENLQIFGEWLYAKHSIHYGCEGCCDERNQGPPLNKDIRDNDWGNHAYFQVFGVFDTKSKMWLSWDKTESWAHQLGFPTVPVMKNDLWLQHEGEVYDKLFSFADEKVREGHEGIVVRSRYPFHYGQFDKSLGKYVRENHVQTEEHWSHTQIEQNKIQLDS